MDLRTDRFEEVVGGQIMHQLTGSHGCASEAFRTARKSVVSREDQKSMREFFDVTTLADYNRKRRLRENILPQMGIGIWDDSL